MHVPDFSQAKVLVVGDVMLDRYWTGATSRVSPEAPVPVVHVSETEDRPGGAANVALNIAALGGQVSLMGLVGEDEAADALTDLLTEQSVNCHWVRVPSAKTITKLRVMSRHQQMIRLDFEDGFESFDSNAFLSAFSMLAVDADLIVFSDYAKGCLTDVQSMIQIAKQLNIPTLVDPKGHDFSRYAGATLLTPNESEFNAVAVEWKTQEEFIVAAQALRQSLDLEALLVTRSEKGMALFESEQELHVPTQAREVFDVTGAGDTVIGTLAVALAAGEAFGSAMALSNAAAGVVVGKLGTASVSRAELIEAVKPVFDSSTGVMSEDDLNDAVKVAKQRGETIVMTNGCFDILHAGHVQYLNQAKALGDRLIVAVNSDESVKTLKGKTRPVNPLNERMAVLSALEAVDWVVAFEGSKEDSANDSTPRDVICRIQPDILVKGGDYEPHQVAGNECAKKVEILSFKDGCSTSSVIEKIKA